MTRVDFYILADVEDVARYRFACRLAGRAATAGKRVHVRADEDAVDVIDEVLWDYPRDQFLPHVRFAPEADRPLEPVVVGAAADTPAHRDVLINLTAGIPDFFAGFERVCEVLLSAQRAQGRAKYRQYRERGYPLFHHELDDWE